MTVNTNITFKSLGNTHIEGKPFQNEMFLITIGNKEGGILNTNLVTKIVLFFLDPILFFDCGIHARKGKHEYKSIICPIFNIF